MLKTIIANEKQIDSIREYLAQRFGIYGIKQHKFEVEETPRFSYGMRIFQDIKLNGTGIFKHALTKCEFVVEVWRRSKDEGFNYCSTHLNYEHSSLGSNGCELDCNFLINEDGEITEKYRY